jgi:hypothetical protein
MEHAQSILGDERARTGNIFCGYQGINKRQQEVMFGTIRSDFGL